MGFSDFLGGPSNEMKWLGMDEMGLSKTMTGWMNTAYGKQQDILNQLQGNASRLATGNTGMGFGAAENSLLRGEIMANGAAGARNALQATMNARAGLGGGGFAAGGAGETSSLARAAGQTAALTSQANIAGETATTQGLAAETLANIQQGRTNALQTQGALSSLAGFYDPTRYAQLASQTNQQAFGQESKINELNQQRAKAIGSLAMTGLGLATGGITGGLAAGGGFLDTLKGVAGGALGDSGMFLTNPTPAPDNSGNYNPFNVG